MKLFATATALGSLALSTVAQMDGNSGDYASQLLGALQQYKYVACLSYEPAL